MKSRIYDRIFFKLKRKLKKKKKSIHVQWESYSRIFFSKIHVQRFILQNDFVIALIGGLSVDYRWD